MHRCRDRLSAACDAFGLVISTTKTGVMFQPAPGKDNICPVFAVNGQTLLTVDKFTYLGSTMSWQVHVDTEVNSSLAKASAAFGRPRRNVCDCTGLSPPTKLMVYKAVVLSTSLLLRDQPRCPIQSSGSQRPLNF